MHSPADRGMPWDKGETSLHPQKAQEKIAVLCPFLVSFLFPPKGQGETVWLKTGGNLRIAPVPDPGDYVCNP